MYVIATVFCSNFHFSVSLHVPFSQFLFERDSYSNAYLLAKFGFDTAENELCKVCPIKRSQLTGLSQASSLTEVRGLATIAAALARARDAHGGKLSAVPGCGFSTQDIPTWTVGHDTSLFSRLVLGCIETKFCNQIRIFSGFSRSTKLSS